MCMLWPYYAHDTQNITTFLEALWKNVEICEVDDCAFGFLVVETLLQGSLALCLIHHCYWYFEWESWKIYVDDIEPGGIANYLRNPINHLKLYPAWIASCNIREKGKAKNMVFIHSFIHIFTGKKEPALAVFCSWLYCPVNIAWLDSTQLLWKPQTGHVTMIQSWAGVGVVSNGKVAFHSQPAWFWITAFPFESCFESPFSYPQTGKWLK